LNRIAYYHPSWAEEFHSKLDWSRLLTIILSADSKQIYAINKLVGALFLVGHRESDKYDFSYIEDIVPFIVRAINEDPIEAIGSLDNIFSYCLGFMPYFLRGGVNPNKRQLQIAQDIVSKLHPENFAFVMKNLVSRDMENLARSLSLIREVDPSFITKVIPLIPEDEFHISATNDWRIQSDELKHLLTFFCIGEDLEPARGWILRNQESIEGPLKPLLAAIAPEIAVNFYKAGKGVILTERYQQRWGETAYAIANITGVDNETAVSIVTAQFDDLENKIYSISLDNPRYIVFFFRALHELSRKVFLDFVDRLNLNDPRATKTIIQLVQTQPKERKNYVKLARLAARIGGKIGVLGNYFLTRLEEESMKHSKRN
jgi:hypothetical protein